MVDDLCVCFVETGTRVVLLQTNQNHLNTASALSGPLDVVVGEGAAILELLTSEDEALVVRWDDLSWILTFTFSMVYLLLGVKS